MPHVTLQSGLSLTKSFNSLGNQPKDKDFSVPHRKTIRFNFCHSLKDICKNMLEKLLSLNDQNHVFSIRSYET